ncbi:MAG TPA: PBP1A family penicillin-binding protein [Thermoanaerobaculia bacterium]
MRPSRRVVFQTISIVVVAILVLIALLSLYVYKESVGKFEIRRLSLPTRVYADYTLLHSGVVISPDDLLEKLDRLGYREVNSVAQSGDYASKRGEVYVYTREFTHPSGKYEAQPVRVTFEKNAISSISSLKDGTGIDKAALEPELLTSILADQLENRRPATLNQIPQHLQDAVIVTEDVRFWHHPGVDPFGIVRAIFRNLRAHGVSEGASTLTQQLVKNYYLTPERTLRRKLVEQFMAVILDAKYSKQEILEAYLNDIYLGRNRSISIIGVGEASHYYFGKPVSEISVAEAAMLAGIIKSPNNYSPFVRRDLAMQRRNTVLNLMLDNKKIDRGTYEKAMTTPLPKKPFREKSGLASIPFYVDRVLQEMSRDYGVKDVKGRGLQIYTAVDLNAQDAASRILESGLAGLERSSRYLRRQGNPLQGAIIMVDVPAGEIRALIGGRNYDYSQFNRATSAKRQIGSLIKPFVYATALEPSLSQQNITEATLVSDTRFILKRRFAADWSPRNYEDRYHGTVTVREALEQSMNSASVRIGLASGIPAVIRTMHTLGVQTDISDNPAMLLGAVGVPPIEMADAYSTIARTGSRLPLRTIRFVTDDRGHVVSAGDAVQPVGVFPARDMYILTDMMKGVLDRGTAAGARSLGFKLTAAGKTGTTNDKRDAWFIGFTPRTLTLTWIGFDDNSPIGLSGGEGAVPIWTRFMQSQTSGQPDIDFAVPPGISFAEVDETSGGMAVPMCPPDVVINEAFKDNTQPMNPCPLHSPQAPALGMVDQFGNPIALDTTGMMPVTTETAMPTPQPLQPPPPQPPLPQPPPPPTTTTAIPPAVTNTSMPTPVTNTSTPPTSTTGTRPP